MICLRCGYCCIEYDVIIVDNPKLGAIKDNCILKPHGIKCQHLVGDTIGKYSCTVHTRRWYSRSPCGTHGQIEQDPSDECRMGRYIIDNHKEK